MFLNICQQDNIFLLATILEEYSILQEKKVQFEIIKKAFIHRIKTNPVSKLLWNA